MKILVSKLKPNPYRRIKQYPIDRVKVDSLKNSIEQTSFWDNIVVREKGNSYEIAYGHHRLVALQELGIKEVDLPVRDISDADMIRIMANENMDEWRNEPAIYTETVLATKEFLDKEIDKYQDLEHVKNIMLNSLFENEQVFKAAKKKGAGREIIHKFLGGNWKKWIIQDALATIKDAKAGTIDRKAVDSLPSAQHAKEFKKAIKKQNIPKKEQKALAKRIKKKEISTKNVSRVIDEHAELTGRKPKRAKVLPPPKIPHIDDFASDIMLKAENLAQKISKITGYANHIEDKEMLSKLKASLNKLSISISKIVKEID